MALSEYNHKEIEKKWQEKWEKEGLHTVLDSVPGKDNFYQLVEFTYPSGNLHVGHWYAFAVPDIFARYKKMQGYNVLYPMGFDAFGLPAENAAIKLGADPKVWTYEQMDRMREQFRTMGAIFPWDREVVSCDPAYYKWTQWMFNQFLKNDLVYRAVTMVNWCPKDQTILANEQVVDNHCERCGTEVVQKKQEQWMLRITKYADRLIDDLDKLDWPTAIKESQKNWIGRSEGSEIEFKSVASSQELETIKVFTTRADTLFGVTYVVLAPEHPLIESSILTFTSGVTNKADIQKYISESKKKSELDRQQSKEKTGIEIKGIKAINPANGEEVPVWIADYVLAGYGTGAVMAVPAHDERDFEFAQKYDLPIKEVIEALDINTGPHNDAFRDGIDVIPRENVLCIVKHPTNDEYLCVAWKKVAWNGFVTGGIEKEKTIEETAIAEIREETGYQNMRIGKIFDSRVHALFYHVGKNVNRHAHYTIVEMILSDLEQINRNEEEESIHSLVWLPKEKVLDFLTRPDMKSAWNMYQGKKGCKTDEGELVNSGDFSGLISADARKKITEFVGGKLINTYRLRDWGISRQRYWGTPIPIVYDPEGKAHAVPDEHLPWTLPTDVDHTPDGTAPLARSRELLERTERIFGKGWKPEVETMDTFVDSSWYFYRYLDNKNDSLFANGEKMKAWMPIDLYMGGAEHTTMHLLYSRFWVKALHDLGFVTDDEAYTVRRNRGLILGPDGNKMSKSKGNVVNPDEIVDRLGADTVRLYLSFMGPYGVTTNYPWDPNGVVGVRRFLERVWRLSYKIESDNVIKSGIKDSKILHKTIKGVTEDLEEFKLNTAISKMMILVNEWERLEGVSIDDFKIFLQLLAPFAPHMTEELWCILHKEESIHLSGWPKYDSALIIDNEITIAIQVNGKVRADMMISADMTEDVVKEMGLAHEKIKSWIEGKEIKKVIYVPGRLVSIVCG